MRSLLLGLLLACIAGCATGDFPGSRPGGSPERRAQALAENGQHEDAARAYIALAADRSGIERDRLALLAIEQWLDAGDGRRARTAMFDVAIPEPGVMRDRWDTNRAAIELWEGRPDGALNILEPMSRRALPRPTRLRVDALRGDAWFQKNDPMRAIGIYTERERSGDARFREQSRQRLWAGLLVSNPQLMRDMAEIAADPVTRGWLSIGALAASTGQPGYRLGRTG